MVIILDGNSEIGAHVRSDLGYLFRTFVKIKSIFFSQIRPFLILTCATYSELPCSINVLWMQYCYGSCFLTGQTSFIFAYYIVICAVWMNVLSNVLLGVVISTFTERYPIAVKVLVSKIFKFDSSSIVSPGYACLWIVQP